MGTKSRGKRAGTRRKLKKSKGSKSSLSNHIQDFEEGKKVIVKIDPSVQKGMPHPKYQGNVGEIKGKQGRCFKLEIKNGNKKKELVAHPAHLKER